MFITPLFIKCKVRYCLLFWSKWREVTPLHSSQSLFSSFVRFRASEPGTSYWHSHAGLQRADGLYGALVVRQPPSNELQKGLYDYDLPEHVMLVTDWLERSTINKFAGHNHAGFDYKPESMLING